MTLGPLMIDLAGPRIDADEAELLKHPLVGGVILFTRNFVDSDQLSALTEAIHAARTPPLIVAVDHEGGRVQRFRAPFALLPTPRRIGHAFDADPREGLAFARQMGWLMAAELRAHGVDLSFAPCVDLDYGVSRVIGDRAFHARAEVVSQLATAYAHGMRDAGMEATAKHFPGHGAVRVDSHLSVAVDRRDFPDLAEDLAPYRRLFDNGLAGVLVAHVLFPAVDTQPASVSRRWIREILRDELRFEGAVFTDDLSMGAAVAVGDIVTRSELALAAGCDMLLICNDRAAVVTALDRLKTEPRPVSHMRIARMRGRAGPPWRELMETEHWKQARALLASTGEAPQFTLSAGEP